MNIPQTEIEYRNALIDAAEVGAEKALIEVGQKSPIIKLTEAQRMHTKRIVNTLIKTGLVEKKKNGERNSTVYLDRIQLITAIKTYYRVQ